MRGGRAPCGVVGRGHARMHVGCSSACEVTSYLSAGQNIPQISWGCEAPTLSSRASFVRTVAPLTSRGPALIAFMKQNKWKRLAMLESNEDLWLDSALGLEKQLNRAGIKVLKEAPFEPGNFKAVTLRSIRRAGFRIVLILSYDTDAESVASTARQEGMTYGWGWLRTWAADVSAAMHGWLCIAQLLPSEGMQAFAEEVSEYSKSHFEVITRPDSIDLAYSAALYNAVMLYAHAAMTVMSEGGDLRDGKAVIAVVRNTTFAGVGGALVALDSNGDRIESYEVMNYVLEEGDVISTVAVGMFNSTKGQYEAYERAVVWPGNMMEVPVDYFSGRHQYCDWTVDFDGMPALSWYPSMPCACRSAHSLCPARALQRLVGWGEKGRWSCCLCCREDQCQQSVVARATA